MGGHTLVVKSLAHPNIVVITVDRGDDIIISEGRAVEILPGVKVQSGSGGNRLAFHAAKSIRISRVGEQKESKGK